MLALLSAPVQWKQHPPFHQPRLQSCYFTVLLDITFRCHTTDITACNPTSDVNPVVCDVLIIYRNSLFRIGSKTARTDHQSVKFEQFLAHRIFWNFRQKLTLARTPLLQFVMSSRSYPQKSLFGRLILLYWMLNLGYTTRSERERCEGIIWGTGSGFGRLHVADKSWHQRTFHQYHTFKDDLNGRHDRWPTDNFWSAIRSVNFCKDFNKYGCARIIYCWQLYEMLKLCRCNNVNHFAHSTQHPVATFCPYFNLMFKHVRKLKYVRCSG